MTQRRLVLADSVEPDDFFSGADEAGWELVNTSEPEGQTLELVFRAGVEGTSTIHYIEDRFLHVRYVLARGPEADAILEDVENHFAHAPEERVVEAAEDDDEDPQAMVDWLKMVTVLGDQVGHERLCSLFARRLSHEYPGIRRAALFCASWLEWPDFRARVEEMAANDPDADVRDDATKLARGYLLREQGEL